MREALPRNARCPNSVGQTWFERSCRFRRRDRFGGQSRLPWRGAGA